MMTTLEVGRKLVSLCREGKNLEAVQTLYAPGVVSIEVCGDQTMPARTQGVESAIKKNQWWLENHQVHSSQADGPWPHDDRFIVVFRMEITPKAGPMAGKRMKIEEAALYTVQEGKITQEEFFYDMSDMGG